MTTNKSISMMYRYKSIGSRVLARSMSTTSGRKSNPLPFYKPTLVESRPEESGRGGRMSNPGVKVAVFGASGFLGKMLCAELGASGFMTYLANRGCDMEMRDRKIPFDLGRTRFVFYSPHDRESIQNVIADADVVVNLIGKFHPTGRLASMSQPPYLKYETNFSLEDANIKVPQTIAEICKEMQVDHLVHVSSASANPDSKSEWSRTKYYGEQAVKEAFPWATIIRPTQMFGKEDQLLSWFAFCAQFFRCVPLAYTGERDPVIQPVWAADVAKAILCVCDDAARFEGRQIDCFGPADFTYPEIYEFVNAITQQNKPLLRVPLPIYRNIARVFQWWRKPLIYPERVDLWIEDFLPTLHPDQYELQEDEKTKILTFKDLGIEPMAMEREAFEYLQAFRFGGKFFRVEGYHLSATEDAPATGPPGFR